MLFLEVLTRCYKRPGMLEENKRSLAMQTSQDFVHTLLVDEVGRGIAWSYRNLAAYAPSLVGDWIFILDDDDMLISETFVADLKTIADNFFPDVVMVKMDHAERGILPGKNWRKKPVMGDIGVSAFVVRREIWQKHARYFGALYSGDFEFIKSIFERDYEIFWFDCVASKVQRISLGAAE